MDGQLRVVSTGQTVLAEKLKQYASEDGEDPQEVVGSGLFYENPVPLTARTLAYWQAAAQRGGYTLNDLIV
jgi:hypothetical protein